MIKITDANYKGDFAISLQFSDGTEGVLNGHNLLRREGELLAALRDETYFKRFFIDVGALCWPNGLELSPAKLHDTCVIETA